MIKPLKIIYKNTIRTSNGTIENEGHKFPFDYHIPQSRHIDSLCIGKCEDIPRRIVAVEKRSRNRDRKQLYGDIRHLGSRIGEQLSRYSRIL